jgi:hypothetical protein
MTQTGGTSLLLTSALDEGECQLSAIAALLQRTGPLVSTELEAVWAPEPVWTLWKTKIKISWPCQVSNPGCSAYSLAAIPSYT